MKFEYKVVDLPATFLEGIYSYHVDEDELNQLSSDGWDVFKFFGGQLILRREKYYNVH